MKEFTFNTISVIPNSMKIKEIDYSPCVDDFGDSVTDFTDFVPSSELIKSLDSSSDFTAYSFDFVNGKDTGMSPPLTRKPGYDIVDLVSDIRSRSDSIREEIRVEKEKMEDRALIDSIINASNQSSNQSPNQSSD